MTLFADNPELLKSFREGEKRALQQVYQTYGRTVYGILRHGFAFQSGGRWQRFVGCGSEHDAEEMMQEVFRRAFEERARLAYDGIRPYRNYISMIGRNLVIDQLRKKRERLLAEDEDMDNKQEEALPRPPGPQTLAEENELHVLVASFCDKLSEKEALVFRNRFVDGKEQEDTAQNLGLSVYKVRTVERGLRKRLLIFLKQHGYLSRLSQVVQGGTA